MDRMARNNIMASSFPWFKSLTISSLEKSAMYHLCYSCQWWPGLVPTDTESIWDDSCVTPRIYQQVRQSLFTCAISCVEAQGRHLEHFFNCQKDVTQKPCFRRLWTYNMLFLHSVDSPSVFSHEFFIHPVQSKAFTASEFNKTFSG